MSFFTKKVGCCCCVCFPKIFVGIYILSIQQYWRSSIYTTTQLLQPVPAFLADLFMFFLRSRATAAAIEASRYIYSTQYVHMYIVHYSVDGGPRPRTKLCMPTTIYIYRYILLSALQYACSSSRVYSYFTILRSRRSVKVGFYAGHSHTTYTTVKIGTQRFYGLSQGYWPFSAHGHLYTSFFLLQTFFPKASQLMLRSSLMGPFYIFSAAENILKINPLQ